MHELDMSRPGYELFPESTPANTQSAADPQENYNSYLDVNTDQVIEDPLNTGVKPALDVADQSQNQSQESAKELNFKALREEAARLKEESAYWKGQAEAYSRQPARTEVHQEEAAKAIDWDDGNDVKRAWETLRRENEALRMEVKDSLAAAQTKATHNDWNAMVTQHVPQLTGKNPIFAEMIKNASNPYEAAYLLAELNARASQPTQQAQVPVQPNYGQRAMHNASKPQTLNSVGGQGQLSAADYYANMSDADFAKIASRNLANI